MTTARQNDKTPSAFELKGSALTLMVLYLFDADQEQLKSQLQVKIAAAAGFFRNAPLIIDGSKLPEGSAEPDLPLLIEELRLLGLVPVALRGGSTALETMALNAGLGLLPILRNEAKLHKVPEPAPLPEVEPPAAEVATVDVAPAAAMVVTRTIRSGQRVVAPHGDLIIYGAVNSGAELLARGNIHVYGHLRGRALAGINGDQDARIFALQFHPDLVAISGEYLLSDELTSEQTGGAVVVTLDNEKLKIETIGTFAPKGA